MSNNTKQSSTQFVDTRNPNGVITCMTSVSPRLEQRYTLEYQFAAFVITLRIENYHEQQWRDFGKTSRLWGDAESDVVALAAL